MITEYITPTSREHWLQLRTQDITSTESAALFGLSPYATAFEMWHQKKDGQIVEIADNKRMKWGRRIEPVIAQGVAADNGWVVTKFEEYARDPAARMGASFDYRVHDPAQGGGILEIKNVDARVYRDGWITGDDGEAPEHIELQLQHQLEVTGLAWGAIAALVGGNEPIVLLRQCDTDVGAAIRQRVTAFWKSIEANEPPPPDFSRDAAFISKLYAQAVEGSVYEGDTARLAELAATYDLTGAAARDLTARKDAARAEILSILGAASKARVGSYSITASTVAGGPVSYVREPYRNFRVTKIKEKK